MEDVTMGERYLRGKKPICLFPCSGFTIPGEAVRRASAIISEEVFPDICDTLGIVELTRAFIDGNTAGFKKKLSKQKVVTIDGCQYSCAKEFIKRFLRIEPEREIIFRLTDREDVADKMTFTKDEDIEKAIRLIKEVVEELHPATQ
ncbi:hypothetical protein DRN98_05350 [Methanosarcinales archaeon]|uniref:DGC domain containing protein n=1 Tax=Candidatus Syntropharchaeum caldarium TaxID=1838285 RepID=A0A1F2PBW8_9EURY|nr:MAG: DGC domain containing protein [Candidatus Syntrophoarchaeum caldarius]RLG32389.1 MAG: hypothetical protein DRN98_05350 [Methanosarcinales archaeon]